MITYIHPRGPPDPPTPASAVRLKCPSDWTNNQFYNWLFMMRYSPSDGRFNQLNLIDMKKPRSILKADGLKTAAYLIQIGIEQYTQSPTLRKRTGIDLVDLNAAAKIRRRLLKQVPKS